MTLDEFVKKYNGKFLEVAGSPGAEDQCVDLANGYIRDVLKLPIIQWTDAKNFPKHPIAKEHFEYIKNTPNGVPQKGDLIIWSGTQWGHIAIFLSGDVNWFTSWDQNWPVGSVCHKVNHSYTNVVGWLRPLKGGQMSDCLLYNNDKDKKTFEELVKKSRRADNQDEIIELLKELLKKILE